MFELVKTDLQVIYEAFKNEFGDSIYKNWLSKLTCISIKDSKAEFLVESRFLKEYIEREYLDGKKKKINGKYIYIKKGIKQILKEFNINEVQISLKERNVNSNYQDNITSMSQTNNLYSFGTELNKSFTFDNFVVGNSNEIAYSVATSIVDGNALKFDTNPFFVYGNVGLGKTHLIQAISWKLKEKHPNENIVYLSVEKFMQIFVDALKNKTMDNFKDKFRNIDTLVIDDIQFLIGKEGTQKEFFYTFNNLLSDNKRVILACDKSPTKLEGLDETLRSRISGGVSIEIAKPDFDMRFKIAQKKANLFGLKCDNKVLENIAKIDYTNRDIEGVVKKLAIEQHFLKKDITLNSIVGIFTQNKKEVDFISIQNEVCKYFNITNEDILSTSRRFALQRQIMFYLCRKHTTKSYPEISLFFNK
ncbi:MAG: chromosomal replication initiator protein DnaA, partial [Rickettsiales bacterium]|nr:chromosomal replication initiator protein DnaA [Rickettsiales bacterium]